MRPENFNLEANWAEPVFFGDLINAAVTALRPLGWCWRTDEAGDALLDVYPQGSIRTSDAPLKQFCEAPATFPGHPAFVAHSRSGARLNFAICQTDLFQSDLPHRLVRMTIGDSPDLGWIPTLQNSSSSGRTEQAYHALKVLARVWKVDDLYLMRRPRYYDDEVVDHRFCLFYFSPMKPVGRLIRYLEERRSPTEEERKSEEQEDPGNDLWIQTVDTVVNLDV